MSVDVNTLPPDERALLERVAGCSRYRELSDLDERTLATIASEQDIDFATALLFDRLCRSGRAFKPTQNDTVTPDTTIAIVPGAFHVEHPETGADGHTIRVQAERLGCRVEVIPTLSLGSPAENAQIIHQWLSSRDEPVVLVSLSKGGADVKEAMRISLPSTEEGGVQSAFGNVRVWICVGGILDGSPLAAWMLDRFLFRLLARVLCWRHGRNIRWLDEIDRRQGGPFDFELKLPKHIRLIHVLAFPMAKHLSCKRTRMWHRRLTPAGPNDSATMLADVLDWPGEILPVWGVNHYMQSDRAMNVVATVLRDVCVSKPAGPPMAVV